MIVLTRTVRFAVNDGGRDSATGRNGYAGVPAMRGLGRHYEVDVTCRGEVEAATGYFKNIKDIDAAARATVVPMIARACRETPALEPGVVLAGTWSALDAALGGTLTRVCWRLSPYYSVEMRARERDTAVLRQRFEFAASHRLHAAALSDDENRRVFGKCNNPAGHGHNYVVEPAVAVRLGAVGAVFTLAELEAVVGRVLIDRYDHKHLNVELPEFAQERGGVNPSVEEIARVCFERLAPEIAAAGATLRAVTVWETEKTSATYPA